MYNLKIIKNMHGPPSCIISSLDETKHPDGSAYRSVQSCLATKQLPPVIVEGEMCKPRGKMGWKTQDLNEQCLLNPTIKGNIWWDMYIVWDIGGYEIYSKKLDLAIRNVDLTWFIQLSSVQNQCWLMISSGIILVTSQSWEYHEGIPSSSTKGRHWYVLLGKRWENNGLWWY